MENVIIHDHTDEKNSKLERASHFFLRKLRKNNHLSKKDNVRVWLEQSNEDYTCKIEVKRDHHSPLFFQKKSKVLSQAIKDTVQSLKYTLSSRDQIWKSKS